MPECALLSQVLIKSYAATSVMQNSMVIGIIIFSSCFDASDTESK